MRNRRFFAACAALTLAFLIPLPGAAQDAESDLQAVGELVVEASPYGTAQLLIRGMVSNRGERAYGHIRITATVFDVADVAVGEGAGYLTRACGTALSDHTLAPGAEIHFTVPLELWEASANPSANQSANQSALARHQIEVSGEAREDSDPELPSAFQRISGGEVVVMEWLSPTRLRYAIGCATAPFTALRWQEYDTESGEQSAIEHPLSARIDERFRLASGIDRYTQSGGRDEALFAQSFLRSHSQARRLVFQNDLGHLMTAEANGSYPRVVDESGFRNSLQGIDWLGAGRFLAYSYGTYGDAVRYVSGHVDGTRLSDPLSDSLPSQTRPGASSDGLLFLLGLAAAKPPGYYLKLVARSSLALLYATALPGNNAPAPILYRDGAQRLAYFITPVSFEASWQLACMNRDSGAARALTALPIHLPPDQRAWLALSPDGGTLALAADGGRGGLWLFALPAQPC